MANGMGIACVALVAASAHTAFGADWQTASAATASAVRARPELVNTLSKELGATPEHAAGAAGALFGVGEIAPQTGGTGVGSLLAGALK